MTTCLIAPVFGGAGGAVGNAVGEGEGPVDACGVGVA